MPHKASLIRDTLQKMGCMPGLVSFQQACCLDLLGSPTSFDRPALPAVTLIMVTVPLVFNLGWQRERCGPHQGTSMQAALVNAVATGPK